MFFNIFITNVSYFPLLFKKQLSMAASDLHSFYKYRLFMIFCGYLIKQSLFTIGQEVVGTTPLHAFCLNDNFFYLTVLVCLATQKESETEKGKTAGQQQHVEIFFEIVSPKK